MSEHNNYSLKQIALSWIVIFVVSFFVFIYIVFSNFLSKHIDQSSFKDLRYAEYLVKESVGLEKESFRSDVARHVGSEFLIKSIKEQDSALLIKNVENWKKLGQIDQFFLYDRSGVRLSLTDFNTKLSEARLSKAVLRRLIRGYDVFNYKTLNDNIYMEVLRRVTDLKGNLIGYIQERKSLDLSKTTNLLPEDVTLLLHSRQGFTKSLNGNLRASIDKIAKTNSKAFEIQIDNTIYDGVSYFLESQIKFFFLKRKLREALMNTFYRNYLIYFVAYILFISLVFYISNYRLIQKPLKELGLFAKGDLKDVDHLNDSVEEVYTIKKLIEKKINQYNKSIFEYSDQREKEVNMMVASVAHELNNALSYFGGNLSYIKDDLNSEDPDIEEIQDALSDIEKGFERMKNIVSDLKVFSSKSDFSLKPEEVVSLLEEIKKEYPDIIINKDLREKTHVMVDRERVMQVLKNLIQNAKQAYPAKSKESPVYVNIYRLDDEFLYCDICDNASGIPDDVKKKIFAPFFTTKKNMGGTGLGLSLSRNIVRGMTGDLYLKDTSSKGSIFCLKLRVSES